MGILFSCISHPYLNYIIKNKKNNYCYNFGHFFYATTTKKRENKTWYISVNFKTYYKIQIFNFFLTFEPYILTIHPMLHK